MHGYLKKSLMRYNSSKDNLDIQHVVDFIQFIKFYRIVDDYLTGKITPFAIDINQIVSRCSAHRSLKNIFCFQNNSIRLKELTSYWFTIRFHPKNFHSRFYLKMHDYQSRARQLELSCLKRMMRYFKLHSNSDASFSKEVKIFPNMLENDSSLSAKQMKAPKISIFDSISITKQNTITPIIPKQKTATCKILKAKSEPKVADWNLLLKKPNFKIGKFDDPKFNFYKNEIQFFKTLRKGNQILSKKNTIVPSQFFQTISSNKFIKKSSCRNIKMSIHGSLPEVKQIRYDQYFPYKNQSTVIQLQKNHKKALQKNSQVVKTKGKAPT